MIGGGPRLTFGRDRAAEAAESNSSRAARPLGNASHQRRDRSPSCVPRRGFVATTGAIDGTGSRRDCPGLTPQSAWHKCLVSRHGRGRRPRCPQTRLRLPPPRPKRSRLRWDPRTRHHRQFATSPDRRARRGPPARVNLRRHSPRRWRTRGNLSCRGRWRLLLRGRRGRRLARRTRRQQRQRVEVAVRIRGQANAEVDVRLAPLGLAARADRGHDVSFLDRGVRWSRRSNRDARA